MFSMQLAAWFIQKHRCKLICYSYNKLRRNTKWNLHGSNFQMIKTQIHKNY